MIKNLKMELLNSEQTKEIKGGICEKKGVYYRMSYYRTQMFL